MPGTTGERDTHPMPRPTRVWHLHTVEDRHHLAAFDAIVPIGASPVTVTATSSPALGAVARHATRRHYLMCPPTYFDVSYAINPWMDTSVPVNQAKAVEQWEILRETYRSLGHRVDVIEPVIGLPDMVFAANGALVVGGEVMGVRFQHTERAPEAAAYAAFLRGLGYTVHDAEHVNEGEGDFLVVGRTILAGTGFRTAPAAHLEVQERLGRPLVTLQLVDPRFYHLDTALAVLDDRTIAYLPSAFSRGSRRVLESLFPEAILAAEQDAAVLGLNAVSDGRNVVLDRRAEEFADELSHRGFNPVPVDMSELNKAGGGVKCCTLEVRA